jgi:hypothetical protein
VKCDKNKNQCWLQSAPNKGIILHGRGGLVPSTVDFSVPLSFLKTSKYTKKFSGAGKKRKKKTSINNILKGLGKKKRRKKVKKQVSK